MSKHRPTVNHTRHFNGLDRDFPQVDGVSTRAILQGEEKQAEIAHLATLLRNAEHAHALSGDSAATWPEWYARFIVDHTTRAETALPAIPTEVAALPGECDTCGTPHIGLHGPYTVNLASCPDCRKSVLSSLMPLTLLALPALLAVASFVSTWSSHVVVDSLMAFVR